MLTLVFVYGAYNKKGNNGPRLAVIVCKWEMSKQSPATIGTKETKEGTIGGPPTMNREMSYTLLLGTKCLKRCNGLRHLNV